MIFMKTRRGPQSLWALSFNLMALTTSFLVVKKTCPTLLGNLWGAMVLLQGFVWCTQYCLEGQSRLKWGDIIHCCAWAERRMGNSTFFKPWMVVLMMFAALPVAAEIGRRHIVDNPFNAQTEKPISQNHLKWHTAVENAARLAHIPTPTTQIVTLNGWNAFIYEKGNEQPVLMATTNLVERLSPEQLQAAAAHELSHLVNDDASFTQTFLLPITGFIGVIFLIHLLFRLQPQTGTTLVIIQTGALVVCGFLLASSSQQKELRADEQAAQWTSKNQMMETLDILEKHSLFLENTQGIYPVPALNRMSSAFDTHPSYKERRNALMAEFDS